MLSTYFLWCRYQIRVLLLRLRGTYIRIYELYVIEVLEAMKSLKSCTIMKCVCSLAEAVVVGGKLSICSCHCAPLQLCLFSRSVSTILNLHSWGDGLKSIVQECLSFSFRLICWSVVTPSALFQAAIHPSPKIMLAPHPPCPSVCMLVRDCWCGRPASNQTLITDLHV